MKRILLAGLIAPALWVAGCADNSALQRDVDALKKQVADLKSENQDLRGASQPVATNGGGISVETTNLLARLEKAEGTLDAANKRIAELEAKPAGVAPAAQPGAAAPVDEKAYADFKALSDRYNEERDAARRADREKRQAEQMAEAERIAKENGLEFDPNNPQESFRKIMMDPEKRQKAMEAMRNEWDKRRFANTGLDESQVTQVKEIEKRSRDRIRETMQTARESGATQEEISQQIQQVNKEQEDELKRVMTEEQYKKYQENGGSMGGMMGGLGGMGGMIPPGMIPGFGGEGGGGR